MALSLDIVLFVVSFPHSTERAMSKQITAEELKKHNKADDCWLAINGKVYDVTSFLPDHPGGKKAPLLVSGADATEEFEMLHKAEVLDKYAKDLLIGELVDGPSSKL